MRRQEIGKPIAVTFISGDKNPKGTTVMFDVLDMDVGVIVIDLDDFLPSKGSFADLGQYLGSPHDGWTKDGKSLGVIFCPEGQKAAAEELIAGYQRVGWAHELPIQQLDGLCGDNQNAPATLREMSRAIADIKEAGRGRTQYDRGYAGPLNCCSGSAVIMGRGTLELLGIERPSRVLCSGVYVHSMQTLNGDATLIPDGPEDLEITVKQVPPSYDYRY